MSLAPGTVIGTYEVSTRIGAGGMGEVYAARDRSLNRDVALKVLPTIFATDADRLARFTREAQTLAQLNHPNIAHVYGFEQSGGIAALVMELVDGSTVADMLSSGALAQADALDIARQVAEAMESAHEHGIVHRDLKPANIKVRRDGTVKVLDFGLAKAMGADHLARPIDGAESPTITSPAVTQAGVILGTAAYMAPEQARGKPVDRRADIWAFGCVLFEMLAGHRPFDGETVSDVVSAILSREPEWGRLPPGLSPAVVRMIRRSLVKDPRKRLRDIGDARIVLEDPNTDDLVEPGRPRRTWQGTWRLVALAGGMIGVLALAMAVLSRSAAIQPAEVTRFDIQPPDPDATLTLVFRPAVALSASGRTVAFVATADGIDRVFVRTKDDATARAIPGSEGGSNPAVSPDGKWVAFYADAKVRKAPIDGEATTIGPAPDVRGLAWSDNETLVLTPNATAPLVRMSASGGSAQPLTTLSTGERTHRWVDALPGTEWTLFTVGAVDSPDSYDEATVEAVSVRTRERRVVLQGAAMARYCGDGWLMYLKGPALYAVRFDPARLAVSGSPIQVLSTVARDRSTGAGHFACARDGTLAIVAGTAVGEQRQLVWFDEAGRQQAINLPAGPFQEARVSPDGKRAALLSGTAGSGDVWVYEFETAAFNRLTFSAANAAPIWSGDGHHVYYTMFDRTGGSSTLLRKRWDGSQDAETLGQTGERAYFVWVEPGEQTAILEIANPRSDRGDIVRLRFGRGATVEKLVATAANEYTGAVSPGGEWLAYNSDATGRAEIYVRELAGGGRWQVTSTGGLEPHWASDGRWLYYRTANRLMAVPIEAGTAFRYGRARPLFDGIYSSGIESGRSYHVDPVRPRFLLVRPADEKPARAVRIVLNWHAAVGR
jgi:Tol biopolymer transport system component